MTVAEKIKKLRLNKSMTQKQLGKACGMAESTIRQYELGLRRPKINTLSKIAFGLGISTNDLIDGTDYYKTFHLGDVTKLVSEIYENELKREIADNTSTIAAHFDGDEYTEEELDKIREFAAFVKSQRNKKD